MSCDKLEKRNKLRYSNHSLIQDFAWLHYEKSAKRACDPKKYFYTEYFLREARDDGYISDEEYHEIIGALWKFLYRL